MLFGVLLFPCAGRHLINQAKALGDLAAGQAGVEVRRLDWQRPPPDLSPFEARIVFAERSRTDFLLVSGFSIREDMCVFGQPEGSCQCSNPWDVRLWEY